MRYASSTLALIAFIVSIASAFAREPRSDPGAEAWVFVGDLPPFTLDSFGKAASLSTGKGGLAFQLLGDHTDDVVAGVSYRDRSRDMLVGVGVIRNGRTDFLDHLIEARFRDTATARMDLPESNLVQMLGQAVFLFCSEPPSCKRREYLWRSGDRIVVSVKAKAFTSDLGHAPCPEPTEILQAYLQRYPSSLTFYTEDDEHAKKWRRERAALEITSAEYWLDQAASAPVDRQLGLLESARDQLRSFAELRNVGFGGAAFGPEHERIAKAQLLPAAAQLRELKKIQQEYQQWWNVHQNDPVIIPPK